MMAINMNTLVNTPKFGIWAGENGEGCMPGRGRQRKPQVSPASVKIQLTADAAKEVKQLSPDTLTVLKEVFQAGVDTFTPTRKNSHTFKVDFNNSRRAYDLRDALEGLKSSVKKVTLSVAGDPHANERW